MSTTIAPVRPALTRWIIPAGIGLLLAIGVLWAIPVDRICIAIDPPPPECRHAAASGPALVGSVLLVFGYAALVVCALLLPGRRRPLVLGILSGALGVVFLVSLLAALAGAGSGPMSPYPMY